MADCTNCLDAGWVCESHPDKPWDKDLPSGCVCNAGMPCPMCNPPVEDDSFGPRDTKLAAAC